MKRLCGVLLALAMLFSLCGCEGNFGSVNLNDPIAIPDDGVIKESVIKQIQSENAVGVFTGTAEGVKYEWTIFGSDIAQAEEINLSVKIFAEADGGIRVAWQQQRAMGFSALLSIYFDKANHKVTSGYNGTPIIIYVVNTYAERVHDDVKTQKGVTLSKLARKYYDNTYCWVYIYIANKDRLADPNNITPGMELIIPELTEEEMKKLHASADKLKSVIAQIEL